MSPKSMSPLTSRGCARGRPHDHVVVVRVPVDQAAPQAGEGGRHLRLVPRERPLDERATAGIGDAVERPADPAGAREVPGEVAVGVRVIEAREGAVHLAEQPSERAQQLRRAGAGLREGRPREPRQHPDQPGSAVRSRDDRRLPARAGRHDAGQGQVRRALADAAQRRTLQLDEAPLARGVHGLQHEGPAVGGDEPEVVVELPREHAGLGLEAVEAAGERGRVGLGQRMGGAALGLHGGIVLHFTLSSRRRLALSEYGPPNGGRC